MKKCTKCLAHGNSLFCVEIEWQGSASGKVTCDAKSGKLGAHQVEGAGGWHQVLGRGAMIAARGAGSGQLAQWQSSTDRGGSVWLARLARWGEG